MDVPCSLSELKPADPNSSAQTKPYPLPPGLHTQCLPPCQPGDPQTLSPLCMSSVGSEWSWQCCTGMAKPSCKLLCLSKLPAPASEHVT